jgi:hypothetical protein
MKKTAILLFNIGLAFGLIETIYFGGNMHPESYAEKICDIIAGEIISAGIGLRLIVAIQEKIIDRGE